MAVEGGELDLNVWEPVIIKNLTEQFKLLTGSMIKFADLCIDGIQANVEKLRADAEKTMANATVASTILGYVKGTEIAHKAVAENKTVKQVVRELKLFDDAEIDKLFDTLKMTGGSSR